VPRTVVLFSFISGTPCLRSSVKCSLYSVVMTEHFHNKLILVSLAAIQWC